MRLFLLITFCLLAIGCNSDPRCRRETALLRSEILDLEDKYYLLKSENDSLRAGQGIVNDSYISGSPIEGEPVQSYYTDTGEPYYPIVERSQISTDGQIVYDDEITYDEGVYQGETADQLYQAEMQPSGINLAPNEIITPAVGDNYDRQTNSLLNEMPSVLPSEDLSPSRDFELPDDLDSDMSNLLEGPSEDVNEDLNILLSAPEVATNNLEIGYDQSQPVREVTEVLINRSATMGKDVDGLPGDEGLDLLIQTKTADGRIELVAGELTVSVIDPQQPAARQRIGLWKFLPEESRLFFANSELGSYGILLHLPWDQQTPVNRKLIVHVRFMTPDGRSLATSSEVRITPPPANYSPEDPDVTGWTRRDSRWIPNLDARMKSPRPRSFATEAPSQVQWQKGGVSNRNQRSNIRRTTPAIPAKAQIQKPAWRPIR